MRKVGRQNMRGDGVDLGLVHDAERSDSSDSGDSGSGEGDTKVGDTASASREADPAAAQIGTGHATEEGGEDVRGEVGIAKPGRHRRGAARRWEEDGRGDGATLLGCGRDGAALRGAIRTRQGVVPGAVQDVAAAAPSRGGGGGGDDAHTAARPASALERFGRVAVEPDGTGDGPVHRRCRRRRRGSSSRGTEHLDKVDRDDVGPHLAGLELGQERHGGAPPVGSDGGPEGLDLGGVALAAPTGAADGGGVDPVGNDPAQADLPLDALSGVGRVGFGGVQPPLGEGEVVREG